MPRMKRQSDGVESDRETLHMFLTRIRVHYLLQIHASTIAVGGAVAYKMFEHFCKHRWQFLTTL